MPTKVWIVLACALGSVHKNSNSLYMKPSMGWSFGGLLYKKAEGVGWGWEVREGEE